MGPARWPSDWVQLSNGLTGRTELRYLTMLPWAEIFDWKRLLPEIQESVFTASRIHGKRKSQSIRRFSGRCAPSRFVRLTAGLFLSGALIAASLNTICLPGRNRGMLSCLSWLGSTPDQTNLKQYEDVIGHDLWVAAAAGELIAAAPDLKTSPKIETVRKAIRVYLQHAVKRYADSPEHRQGLAELRRYPRTERLFELGQILHLSWLLGTTPLKLLTG